ncbi:MFS transporter [Actinokineospora iranica]|uniref:Predicted arabinose efflux permease, MFS family n=1 Tax=Actinokineospora iranica TaxID=1271860 RepID=A0A1G6Z9C1_9PSEU|nr:MFS transporter [Actinokineospora iranica]SDD99344.1 Predicted arabinose efflux permease, MFS family [Actinokineospora iranica]
MTAPGDSAPDRARVLGTIALIAFLSTADNTVVAAAAPSVAGELALGVTATQGVTVAYLLPFAGLLLAAGPVVDRFGERAALRAGLAVFAAGTVLAACARAVEPLLAGRVLQGLAAALLVPATLSLVRTRLVPADRPKGAAVWTVSLALALAAGPVVGGFVSASAHWSWVFWGVLPLLVGTWAALPGPGPRTAPRPVDRLGMALAGVTMLLVTAALLSLADGGEWSVALAVTGVVAALVFANRDRRSRTPVLPPALVGAPLFRGALLVQTLWGLGVTGITVVTPLVHQRWLGLGPAEAALPLAAVAAALILTAPWVPKAQARLGAPATVAGGLVVVGVGLAAVAAVNHLPSVGPRLPGLLLVGIGSAFTVPLTTMALDSADDRLAGAASGVLSAAREFAGALGVALVAVLIAGAADGPAMAQGYTRALLVAAALQLAAAVVAARLRPNLSLVHNADPAATHNYDKSAVEKSPLPLARTAVVDE